MHEWIALDGVKSTELEGVEVLSCTPPLLAPRTRTETVLAGRLTAVTQQAWQREPVDLEISLALVGESLAAMLSAWQARVLPWLYNAARLELEALPGLFFRGAVTGAVLEEQTDAWLRARVTFRCNPPLPLRLRSGAPGWTPDPGTPVPPQLTAERATASGSFTGAGFLSIPGGVGGQEPAETYLAVSGSWDRLLLGSAFAVEQAAENVTLYIDCENAQVWRLTEDGLEVNCMGVTSGELPALSPGASSLAVGGEEIGRASWRVRV